MQQVSKLFQEIINAVNEWIVNPFLIEFGITRENKQPLVNIATSLACSPEATEALCNVRENVLMQTEEFVTNRLIKDETDFHDPISKQNLCTFTILNKGVVTKKKQVIQALDIDRQIFSKLEIIAQSCDVDIEGIGTV